MPNDNVQEQLIQATIKLLTESTVPANITARQIASEAGANLAMINYYFNSKDKLVSTAVEKIIEDRAASLKTIMGKEIPAKQKLVEFIITMTDIMMEYSDITRPSVPYVLLEGKIEVPYYILPIIKECFENKKTETECKIVAYQLISSLQLIFYRAEDYLSYTGIEIKNEEQRNKLLQTIVELYI